MNQGTDKGEPPDVDRKSHASSRHTASSSVSVIARKRAEVEAARTKAEFAVKEAEIRRRQAIIAEQQSLAAAHATRVKAELDTDLEVLHHQKNVAAAEAVVKVLEEHDDIGEEGKRPGENIRLPTADAKERTKQYVSSHESLTDGVYQTKQPDPLSTELPRPPLTPSFAKTPHRQVPSVSSVSSPAKYQAPQVTSTPGILNPHAPLYNPLPDYRPQSPDNTAALTNEFTRFLLKRDLLLSRLSKFDDRPESYSIWKSGFLDVMRELQVTVTEELDLLVKWLGPESCRNAIHLRAANVGNPGRGLDRIWERLDDRYGSPEMVEAALKAKLNDFPKLTNRDNKKLYELCDILSEIESTKENEQYRALLSYFDASSGVIPIVSKLPYGLQEKWTAQAVKYKRDNNVSFPPFWFFVQFIREVTKARNDPSFFYEAIPSTPSQKKPTGKSGNSTVMVRKTEVSQQSEKDTNSSPNSQCPLHKSNHALNQCRAFKAKPLEERKKLLKDMGVCFKCCASTEHMIRSCKETVKCSDCGSTKHPSAMHVFANGQETTLGLQDIGGEKYMSAPFSSPVTPKCTQICGSTFGGKSCGKTVLVKVYPKNQPWKQRRMYAILDDQSNATLGKSDFFDMFGVHSEDIPYTISSCTGCVDTSGRRAHSFIVEAVDGSATIELPTLTECNQIPDVREEIPTPEVALHHGHLSGIATNIPSLDDEAQILLLIGRDVTEAHHVLDQRIGPRNAPYAQKLHLGWVIVGEACLGNVHRPHSVNVNKTYMLANRRPSTFTPCGNNFTVRETYDGRVSTEPSLTKAHYDLGASVFERTSDDDKIGTSVEDREFIAMMDKEVFRDQEGNWVAPLPFRCPRPRLPNNRNQALKRARILHNSLQRNPTKRQHFVTFMQGILDRHHAERAPPIDDQKECWYLPIFGVYHPKKPDQIRAVFDSSALTDGVSLNSVLLRGPDLTNSLLGVLLRFRKEPVAVTADIQHMFHCFLVREDHRDFLRFLWYRDNNTDNELIEYRMRVHVFGNSPSPAVATYSLRRVAQEGEETFGSDVKNFVENDFYVDDALTSLPTTEAAIDLLNRTREALRTEGNIRLHKLASNKAEVMQAFPVEDRANDLKDLNLSTDVMPLRRSLGLYWDLGADSFTFQVSLDDKPFTRRGILSTVNSLFDPLGFAAPVIIQGKLLLRGLMTLSTGWDEELPTELQHEWEKWKDTLQSLEHLQIPRSYVNMSLQDADRKEIHIFSDASEKAIAAVAFLKTTDFAGNQAIGFLLGKAKVAPSHGHTIPRLELCAAVLAVEIGDTLSTHLNIQADTLTFHTDSKIVLGYIHNQTRRFYVYVSNRVERIRRSSNPEQWIFTSTDTNPADLATRSIPASHLGNSMWLLGPPTLHDDQPKEDITYDLADPEDKEVRPIVIMQTGISTVHGLDSKRFERFSSWKRLVNAIALLKHHIRVRSKEQDCEELRNSSTHRTVDEYNEAERTILKVVQMEVFGTEINCIRTGKPLPKKSSLLVLSPFLDKHGVLRLGGRLNRSDLDLNERNPVIIPGKHHIGTLLVRHFHNEIRHQGRHLTEGAVRTAGYWITGGKRLISSLIYKCVTCRKLRGRQECQKMSDLPSDRLTPAPPFTYVGVDTFGPWGTVTRRTRGGQASSKRWAILFTCLVTRAIHIEVIEEMTSSSFINSLRRFISIRGKVKEFRSDRGTNFVGSTDSLGISAINVEDEQVAPFLLHKGTRWIFNPPHSSHMGGVWERMIGVTRRILDSMLLEHETKHLTHEVLCTFMAEVSAIVNARPIVPVSADPQSPTVLSPSMILNQKSDHVPEFSGEFDSLDMYKAQWRRVQHLANTFWSRWRKEYLHTLQNRRKWKQDSPSVKCGDIVLLKDNGAHRNDWPIGVVTRTIPSEDNRVRKTEIRVLRDGKATTFIRPISDTVVLLSE